MPPSAPNDVPLTSSSDPSIRQLLAFWFPLAASWLLMGIEGPSIQAAIARVSSDAEQAVQFAAFGQVFFLQVLIEAPVIMLLSTSTALARDEAAYRCLRRFAWHLALGLSVLALALAATPLFDLVVLRALAARPEVAEAMRPGLWIMIPWTACIGLRRFLQGIMIRQGRTRRVGLGTAVRCAASLGTAAALATRSTLSGVEIGAWALVAGVAAEAAFTAVSARPAVEAVRSMAEDPARSPLRYAEVLRFHLPLAATSTLSLIVQPVALGILARLPGSELSQAAWPVVIALLMVFHAGSYALPEVVIAQRGRGSSVRPLVRFGLAIGLSTAALLALFVLSPAAEAYLVSVKRLRPELVEVARAGLQVALVIPLLHMGQNLARGLRVAAGSTARVYGAMSVHLGVVVLGLGAALAAHERGGLELGALGGIRLAQGVFAAAYLAEILVLCRGLSRLLQR